MMMFIAVFLSAFAARGEEPTHQYISCVQTQVAQLRQLERDDGTIADQAVANCEEFVAGEAQAFLDEAPLEALASYRAAGITSEQLFERQKQIVRNAARRTALYVLEED